MVAGNARLGWGIAGCGWVARDYAVPAIRASANGRLLAVHDASAPALGWAQRELDGVACHAELDAFLATPGLQAVYIATPNHAHRALAERAAAAGCAVLCEKPMATTLADATRMVQACAAAGVRYATAFDQRFHPAHRELQRLVADGLVGRPTAIRIVYACWVGDAWTPDNFNTGHPITGHPITCHPSTARPAHGPRRDGSPGIGQPTNARSNTTEPDIQRNPDNWRIDPDRAGGGALFDLAPHGLDLAAMILGERIETVAAMGQARIHQYATQTQGETRKQGVDDGALLMARSKSGVLLQMHVAYNTPETLPRRRLEIIGTSGQIVATDTMGQTPGGTLHFTDAADGTTRQLDVPDPQRSPFLGQMEAFAAAMLDGTNFPFTPEHDLHTMALLEHAQSMVAQCR